jgi:hypothetical protein
MLDIEAEGKGYPGSPQYQWTQDVMSQAGNAGPVSVSVPGGGEDDFNYAPFVKSGGMVWIQTYGEGGARDPMDPQQRYNMMLARGVPANQIGLMLAPGQKPVPGVPFAYYGVEDFAGNYPTGQPQQNTTSSFQRAPAPTSGGAPAYTQAAQQAIQSGYGGYVHAPGATGLPAMPPPPNIAGARRTFAV